jgi:hypothetical protein
VASSDRSFIVDEVGEDGRLNRDAVVQAFMECESIGHRIGMGVTAVPVRVEYPRDGIVRPGEPEVETIAWTFKLSRVPLAQRAGMEPEPEEPVAIYEAPVPNGDGEDDEPEAEVVADPIAEAARQS